MILNLNKNFVNDLPRMAEAGLSIRRNTCIYFIADQTFDAMQGAIAKQKLAAYPPDHTILIAGDACGTLEFDRAEEMIALGYESASRCLDRSG